MGSTEPVVKIIDIMQPGSNFAQFDTRTGASTPNEIVSLHDFDPDVIEYLDFKCRLEGYDGGGLTFTLPWSASSAVVGVNRWGVAIRRMEAGVSDIDLSHTYDFNEVDDTAPSENGALSYPVISFTDGVDMDSWADGEIAIARVMRNATHINHTMFGDAELWDFSGKET